MASQKKPTIAVVGGGAAGMMAAITAARNGASVIILERQERIGRKLLATGNGRCNLTNTSLSAANYHGADPGFATEALKRFPVDKTIGFFNDLGLCTRVEEKGKVFPLTGQASTVLDLLRLELERLKMEVRTSTGVRSIRKKGDGFVVGCSVGELSADKVIVAAGGAAAPQLGGSGDGMNLLLKLGHSCTTTHPALVPLKTDVGFTKHLKGIKVEAAARLFVSDKAVGEDRGEILFTDYGLSGPPVIQLSLPAMRALSESRAVHVVLDLFPGWTGKHLVDHLSQRFFSATDRPVDIALIGLLHKRIIQVVLEELRLAGRTSGEISKNDIARIADLLKGWKFTVTGAPPYREAQLMAGGISTRDFNPSTLESRRVDGLFACGEVLDVSGDCGGYNLQWAWSSGHVAGENASGYTNP